MATLLISDANNIRPSNFSMIDQVFDLDEVLTLAEDSTQSSHRHLDDHDHDHQIIQVREFVAEPNLSLIVNYMPPTDHQTTSSGTVLDLDVEYSCMVCMESFHYSRGGQRIQCGHVYHADCIAAWLSVCDSCPLCRRPISAA